MPLPSPAEYIATPEAVKGHYSISALLNTRTALVNRKPADP